MWQTITIGLVVAVLTAWVRAPGPVAENGCLVFVSGARHRKVALGTSCALAGLALSLLVAVGGSAQMPVAFAMVETMLVLMAVLTANEARGSSVVIGNDFIRVVDPWHLNPRLVRYYEIESVTTTLSGRLVLCARRQMALALPSWIPASGIRSIVLRVEREANDAAWTVQARSVAASRFL